MQNSQQRHVQVFVRIKPTDKYAVKNIELSSDNKSLTIHAQEDNTTKCMNHQIADWQYSVDGILHNASQEEVYKKCTANQVTLALNGYNSTIFSYGQTGAGKTFTMTGTTNNFQQRGIIPRAINQLFSEIKEKYENDITVRVSYLEIYNEQMFDLLSTMYGGGKEANLSFAEDNDGVTYVKGLACYVAKTEEEALNYLFEGESNRIISRHQLNHLSSRSHCIFTLHIESHSKTQSQTNYIRAKFNFVDLAGSERLGKTMSKGHTQKEATYINKSLTFLEQTIISLQDKSRKHVPYRQSKLTHFLKDSLGGKCYTTMIGNIWGEAEQLEETLSTLRFATRVMNIPSQPAVNTYQDPVKLCQKYEKEITHLRKELAMYDTLTNRNQVNYEPLSDVQVQDIRQQVRKYLDNDISEIEVLNLRQIQETFVQFKYFLDNMEKEGEKRLKEKYVVMGEKSVESNDAVVDNVLIPAVERHGLVGENDGTTFSVGRVMNGAKQAHASPAVAARKRNKKGKESTLDQERKCSANTGVSITASYNANDTTKTSAEEPSSTSVNVDKQSDGTPPSREEGFIMFKSDQGSSLNKIFLENKEILHEKKCSAKHLTEQINQTKRDIDDTKAQLETAHQSKEYLKEKTSEGEIIMDENEFDLLRSLKTSKNIYRENYEQLQKVRADIVYCEDLVKQCRRKLLAEFEQWYSESFPTKDQKEGAANNNTTAESAKNSPTKNTFQRFEDDGEKFDKIQKQALMKDPESIAFYNARLQTERRKLYGGSAQPTQRPGSVISSLRNAPPKTMMIHS